jgi:glyoxylase-like metal-dependent hydrolase (beta-lactamase superfamily II)
MSDKIYFKQLLGGVHFGRNNPACGQMQNFIYLIGDKEKKECMIIDPAWAVDELVELAERDGMKVVGALATHYHPDHVGGSMFGFTLEGASRLVERCGCRLHCHKEEANGIRRVTGLEASDLVQHNSGDKVKIGDLELEVLHTPGHTPGSICFRLHKPDALLAGDTLFLQGCGRVDLPGGDSEQMYYTLTQRLSSLPPELMLYPGHAYGGSHASIGEVRKTNPYLQVKDLLQWRRYMG